MRAGILARLGSFWVGAHWSPANRRLCVNLIPCVTLWVTLPGGVVPGPTAKREPDAPFLAAP